MPTTTTPRRNVPRPIRQDCQRCGGTVTGTWRGPDFVCDRAGHVTEPLATGPIRTYA